MSRLVLVACVLAGCFKPSYDHPACGPNRECPSGFSCNAQDVCERPGSGDDDASVPDDGAPHDSTADAPPTDAMFCLGGTGSLFRPCFNMPPSTSMAFANGTVLDTSATGSRCDPTASNAEVCVIAGSTIMIPAGATVTSTGSRALVLAAATTITIDGDLDLGAHTLGSLPSGSTLGPCDGGTNPMNVTGGGGAGGSFVRPGGNGGVANGSGGVAGTVVTTLTAVRGGCAGQPGANGNGNLFATGGAGGGAVYLIAGTSITISGEVAAGGAGGRGGPDAVRAGGGGGGSGGFIGFDAPALNVNNATVIANGGGGGQGTTTTPGIGGANGVDAVGKGAAPGGASGTAAGVGGAGSLGSTAAQPGQPPVGGGGAGGGGGGTGLIRVIPLGALMQTGTAYISPTPQ